MPRVVWTKEASDQSLEIESDDLVDRVIALASGLSRFPERGRKVPDLADRPEYNIVREVILPRTVRVFYLFIPDSNEVLVVGMIRKGAVFRLEALGPYFNP